MYNYINFYYSATIIIWSILIQQESIKLYQ